MRSVIFESKLGHDVICVFVAGAARVSAGDHQLALVEHAFIQRGGELVGLLLISDVGQKQNGGTERLERAYPSSADKQVKVVRGFGFYPSDQKHFPVGVGVAAMHRKPLVGYCLGRIHTRRDTVLDEVNIDLLRAGAVRLLQTMNEKEETHV